MPRPAQVRAFHLQRKAVVYIRQSSPEQVRDHVGSTAAQFELADVARAFGWPESRIVTIHADLGVSARTSTTKRTGFQVLLEMISRGEVGIALFLDVKRMARNLLDAARFIDAAQRASILIYAHDRVYDTASESDADAFSLQLESLLAVRDNSLRVRMFASARAAKAREGYAVTAPPIGYVRSTRGKWVKDPDPAVRDAVQHVFEVYPRLGSLKKVVKYFRSEGHAFPRRVRGEIRPGSLSVQQLYSILRNPLYTGDYIYRRYRTTQATDSTPRKLERRSRSDWITVPNHHDPYVTHENWNNVQELLAAQRPQIRPLLGKGGAHLQGVVWCGPCNSPIHTRYWGRDGQARTATYVCRRTDGNGNILHRVALPARLLDPAVTRHVLAALAPVELEKAFEVLETEETQHSADERMRKRQLRRAEDAVEDAHQAYIDADRTNALVKAELEARFEAALKNRDRLSAYVGTAVSPDPRLTAEERIQLARLTNDVQSLWSAPATTHDDRKRILRTLISQVIARDATKEAVELEIVWVGGFRESISVLLAPGVNARVRERTKAGLTPRAIVDELNAAGVLTARARPMTLNVLNQKLGHLDLRLKNERQVARRLIQQSVVEQLQHPELVEQLTENLIAKLTANAPRLGPWSAHRLSEEIRQMRRGAPGAEPLPPLLPAALEKDQVIGMIERSIAEGKTWTMIAADLNRSEHKPPRGREFTPVQVRLLYLRARGLKTFKLPDRSSKPGSSS